MRLTIFVVKLGNGYRKAIFGQTRDGSTGEWNVDSVFGASDEELLERLKTRLPAYRNQLRRMMQ